MSEWIDKWVNEWMGESTIIWEIVSEWVSEWMNELYTLTKRASNSTSKSLYNVSRKRKTQWKEKSFVWVVGKPERKKEGESVDTRKLEVERNERKEENLFENQPAFIMSLFPNFQRCNDHHLVQLLYAHSNKMMIVIKKKKKRLCCILNNM